MGEVLRAAGRARPAPATIARRVPFTLGVLALMLACGLATGTLWRPAADSALLVGVGYGLPALRAGRPWTLVAGIPFALYPWMIATIAGIVALFVGAYEWRGGTTRAVLVFLATQSGGSALAALAVVWPLASAGWPLATDWAGRLDVGASAGAYGCAGALTAQLPRRWRGWARGGLLAFLLGQLLVSHRIWDIEHLLAAPLGILLGWLLSRGGTPLDTIARWRATAATRYRARRRRRRSWRGPRGGARTIVAALVALAGLLDMLSALLPGGSRWLTGWPEIIPFELLQGTRTVVVAAGFGLVLLARGLLAGRRVAWLAALALLGGTALAHLLDGPDLAETLVRVVLGGVLVWRAGDFRARPDTPTVAGALRTAGGGLLALGLYALAGFALLGGALTPRPTRGQAAREFAARLALASTDAFQGTSFQARWFLDSLTFLWLGFLAAATFALLRAARRPAPERPGDRARARALLRQHGRQSIASMTMWAGNTLLLAQAGDAYLAYRVVNDVALVLGDPVGDDKGLARVLAEFLDLCTTRGWTPCLYAATGRAVAAGRTLGLDALQIAEDTVIDLPDLAFTGKAWQDVRTALNKAERAGIALEWVDLASAPPAVAEQLAAISAHWTADKRLPELGFTLGTLAEARDPAVRTAIAVDGQRTIHGFTTWLPVYADGQVCGWTIDLMRRREGPTAFRGVMEFLIAQAAQAFRAEGAAFISLSAAPLARIADAGTETGGLQRALELLAERLEPFYGFRALLAFKQKFRPRREPVYLLFPGVTSLPRISLAILRAYRPGLGPGEVRALLTGAVQAVPRPERAPAALGAAPEPPQ